MIGERLSHYQVLATAGHGGMGQVYKAVDRRLGRPVALKILPPEMAGDPRRRRRLRQEARAVALASHPGIVSVFDVGVDRGIDYVVMEWVEGKTLRDELADGPVPYARAIAYGAQLADAMAAAHAAGVVHRDLKPQNVMIDQTGRIRVLDFGIAQVEPMLDRDTISRSDDELTKTGATPGTFAYMSPEQILGEPAGPPSDVFSLGVVLHELLTGHRPFAARGLAAFLHQVVFDEPRPASSSMPSLPPEIDAIVSRALAKAPADRPDMATLATELRRLPGVSTAPQPELHAPRAPVRKNRRLLAAAFLPVLAASLIVGAALLRPGAPGNERSQGAPAPLPESPYELYTSGLRYLERYDRESYIDQAIARFEAAIASDDDYAPAHSGLAWAYLRQYRRRRDPVWLHRASARVRRALELAPQLSHARVGRALIWIEQGELDAARNELEALRRLDPANAEVLAAQGDLMAAEGRFDEAAALYREALGKSTRDWEILMRLGITEQRRGDLDAAEEALVASAQEVPDNAFAYRNLAAIYHFQGRYEEAATALQTSISIRPSSTAYSNLGTLYFFRGQYDEAVAAFESARALGANHYLHWANLGDAYRQVAGKQREAEESFRRALQLLRAELADTPPDARTRSRMALYLAKLGDREGALDALADLQPLEERAADTCFRAAVAQELLGARDRALDALELSFVKGHPPEEIRNEPELIHLREDVRFHRIAMRFEAGASAEGAASEDPSPER